MPCPVVLGEAPEWGGVGSGVGKRWESAVRGRGGAASSVRPSESVLLDVLFILW